MYDRGDIAGRVADRGVWPNRSTGGEQFAGPADGVLRILRGSGVAVTPQPVGGQSHKCIGQLGESRGVRPNPAAKPVRPRGQRLDLLAVGILRLLWCLRLGHHAFPAEPRRSAEWTAATISGSRHGYPLSDAGSRLEDLHRSRNARILGELIDVAVWRPKVHPGISALVFRGVQDFDASGPEFAGRCIDVVHKKPNNRPGREVTVHVGVRSKDLHFAAVRQLEHPKPWKIKVRPESQNILE